MNEIMVKVLMSVMLLWLISMPLVMLVGDDDDIETYFSRTIILVGAILWVAVVYGMAAFIIGV